MITDKTPLIKGAFGRWCRMAGRAACRPALIMWYVMQSPDTPRRDKTAIFASLAYLVFPVDILDARRLPFLGWLDEVVALSVLVNRMSKYITPEIEAKADARLDSWFPKPADTVPVAELVKVD